MMMMMMVVILLVSLRIEHLNASRSRSRMAREKIHFILLLHPSIPNYFGRGRQNEGEFILWVVSVGPSFRMPSHGTVQYYSPINTQNTDSI